MSRLSSRGPVVTILLLSSVTVLLVSCNDPGCVKPTVSYFNMSRPLPVMTCGLATADGLVRFFLETRPEADVNEVSVIAEYYLEEAAIEGVNHDVAFCQMCVETDFLRFTGDVRRSQNNFGGIGATGGGVPGDSFETVQIGIRAQIQHLKAYGNRRRLRQKLVDPRWAKVRRGSGRHVEDLSGRWAADPNYGFKIRKKLQSLTKWIYEVEEFAENRDNNRSPAG